MATYHTKIMHLSNSRETEFVNDMKGFRYTPEAREGIIVHRDDPKQVEARLCYPTIKKNRTLNAQTLEPESVDVIVVRICQFKLNFEHGFLVCEGAKGALSALEEALINCSDVPIEFVESRGFSVQRDGYGRGHGQAPLDSARGWQNGEGAKPRKVGRCWLGSRWPGCRAWSCVPVLSRPAALA